MLSGLQHFMFCRRQWALIHVEQQWAENERTVDGHLFHAAAHDGSRFEKRGDILITRSLNIRSSSLGMTGICDVVEFHRSEKGVSLPDFAGTWQAYPVEYKKGLPKENDADLVQLCAQAICLEEMLLCEVPEGSLFYGESRRRLRVEFSEELRERVSAAAREMHRLWEQGYTPKVKPKKGCNACSLKEICIPGLGRSGTASVYIQKKLRED